MATFTQEQVVPSQVPPQYKNIYDILTNPNNPGSSVPSPAQLSGCDVVDGNLIQIVSIPDAAGKDILVKLGTPCKKITCIGAPDVNQGSRIFLHFQPLNHLLTGDPGAIISGLEPWIPFLAGTGSGESLTGTTIKFCKPVSQFFLTVYSVGGASVGGFSFLCSDDLDILQNQLQG